MDCQNKSTSRATMEDLEMYDPNMRFNISLRIILLLEKRLLDCEEKFKVLDSEVLDLKIEAYEMILLLRDELEIIKKEKKY